MSAPTREDLVWAAVYAQMWLKNSSAYEGPSAEERHARALRTAHQAVGELNRFGMLQAGDRVAWPEQASDDPEKGEVWRHGIYLKPRPYWSGACTVRRLGPMGDFTREIRLDKLQRWDAVKHGAWAGPPAGDLA